MKRALPVVFVAFLLPGVLVYAACSSDESSSSGGAGPTPTTNPTTTPTTNPTTDPPGQDSGPGDQDGGTDAPSGDACAATAPNLDGGGQCGSRPFGSPAAILTVADAGFFFDGSVPIPPGVYEVTSGERAAPTIPYNWRETLVLDGTRYTQIRRFETTQGADAPTNARSGTYTLANGQITLVPDCSKNAIDGGDVSGGGGTFSYEVQQASCPVKLTMSVAGTKLTYTKK